MGTRHLATGLGGIGLTPPLGRNNKPNHSCGRCGTKVSAPIRGKTKTYCADCRSTAAWYCKEDR